MRTVATLGGLLAVALAWSYVIWTDDTKPLAPDAVVLLDAKPDQLSTVDWTDDAQHVRIERKTDANGTFFAVTVEQYQKEAPTADEPADSGASADAQQAPEAPADDAAPAPKPAEAARTVVSTQQFIGGKGVADLWDTLAPLTALRELSVGEGGLAAFGLETPSATLVLSRGGQTQSLALGDETFGTRDRYALFGDRVVLIDDSTLRPIEHARTRLAELGLSPWLEAAVDTVALTREEQTRSFVQRHREDASQAFWADADKPDTKDMEAAAFIAKLLRVRASKQVPADEVPEGLTAVFSWKLTSDRNAWTVDVLKREDGGRTQWFARSSYLRGLAELPGAMVDDLLADVGVIFGDEPARPAAPEAPAAEAGPLTLAPAEGAP